MNQINIQYHKTKIGEFIIGSYESKLCLMDFRYRRMREAVDNRIKKGLNAVYAEQSDEITELTKKQLNEYLNGQRIAFDIPLLMVGSDFQESVWKALMKIPYGKTASYLDLAKSINNVKAIRAVAGANGANAMSIIIPCHRIIGNNGELIGYAGGLPAKKQLLNLEQGTKSLFDDLW